MARHLFTSESVTEGHPDKICDQISDAILDEILTQDPDARVACETCVSTGLVHIMGEITTSCYVDFQKLVREVVADIGYTRAKYGFDADTCAVISNIDGQSPDIALGTNDEVGGAGDRLTVSLNGEPVRSYERAFLLTPNSVGTFELTGGVLGLVPDMRAQRQRIPQAFGMFPDFFGEDDFFNQAFGTPQKEVYAGTNREQRV